MKDGRRAMEKEIIGKIKQTTICEKIVAKILDLVEQGVYQPGELLPRCSVSAVPLSVKHSEFCSQWRL